MPLKRCQADNKPGWKWGDSGKCYTYTPGDKSAEKAAKKKAIKQGLTYEVEAPMTQTLVFSGCKINGVALRTEKFGDREYVVAPVVAVREQVLNGQLLPASEIEHLVEAWNGAPVTFRHPTNAYGVYVSANAPDVLDAFGIGRLFYVYYEDRSLKGEIWMDVEKVKSLGDEGAGVIDRMYAGEVIEVSTGYFADFEDSDGIFNGEEYHGIQHGIKPDHLAILPDQIGACSVADGCGFPRNVLVSSEVVAMPEGSKLSLLELVKNFVSAVSEEIVVHEDLVFVQNGKRLARLFSKAIQDQVDGDKSKKEIIRQMAELAGVSATKINDLLKGKIDFVPQRWLASFCTVLDIDPWDAWVAATQDKEDYMSSEEEAAAEIDEDSVSDNEELQVQETATPEETSEENVEALATEEENEENSGVDDLEATKVKGNAMTKCELIDAVMKGNSKFTEDDRSWLSTMSADQLEKLLPNEETEVAEQEAPATPQEQEELEATPSTVEEVVEANFADPETRDLLLQGWREQKQKRKDMVEAIVGNSDYTAKELEQKTFAELTKLHKLVSKAPEPSRNADSAADETDYSGVGGPRKYTTNDGFEVIPAPRPMLNRNKEVTVQ